MKRFAVLTMAALLSAGVVTWTTVRAADEPKISDQAGKYLELPAGIQPKDLKEDKDIKKALSRTTNDAVDHNHFDNLISNFVDQDRDRMKDNKNMDVTKLNEVIGVIRREWKAKYNEDFDITRKERGAVFNDQFVILQGEVVDPNLAMANWPVPVTAELGAKPAADQGHAQPTDKKSEVNLEKGRNVALVRFPDSHGLSALKLSLIHELPDRWRLDVPNNISGQQIHDNLLTQLTWVNDHKDKWPADVDDAYRMVAHHVFMALYDVNIPLHERL